MPQDHPDTYRRLLWIIAKASHLVSLPLDFISSHTSEIKIALCSYHFWLRNLGINFIPYKRESKLIRLLLNRFDSSSTNTAPTTSPADQLLTAPWVSASCIPPPPLPSYGFPCLEDSLCSIHLPKHHLPYRVRPGVPFLFN